MGILSPKLEQSLRIVITVMSLGMILTLNGYGNTNKDLSSAIEEGDVNRVKELIYNGRNLSLQDQTNHALLRKAILDEDTEFVEFLLSSGVKIDLRSHRTGKTPLVLATAEGNYKIVKLLIEHGADVNYETKKDWTPLHMAAYKGYSDIVELLLEKGAHLEAKTENGTALHLAIQRRDRTTIKQLLEAGANVNTANKNGLTPLMVATKRTDDTGIIKPLIDSGADMNARSKNRKLTPLMFSLMEQDFNIDVVKFLHSNGAKINRDAKVKIHAGVRSQTDENRSNTRILAPFKIGYIGPKGEEYNFEKFGPVTPPKQITRNFLELFKFYSISIRGTVDRAEFTGFGHFKFQADPYCCLTFNFNQEAISPNDVLYTIFLPYRYTMPEPVPQKEMKNEIRQEILDYFKDLESNNAEEKFEIDSYRYFGTVKNSTRWYIRYTNNGKVHQRVVDVKQTPEIKVEEIPNSSEIFHETYVGTRRTGPVITFDDHILAYSNKFGPHRIVYLIYPDGTWRKLSGGTFLT